MHQTFFISKRSVPSKAPVWGFISAGSPSDPDPFNSIRRIPIPQGFRRFGMVAFRVTGDSMTLPGGGGLPSGAWVLADRRDQCSSTGDLFAFQLDDGSMVVKRYRLLRGRPAMYSDNPDYDPVQLDNRVRLHGRIYAFSADGKNWQSASYRGWN